MAPPSSPVLRYHIPVGVAQSELVIKNSVFIGTVGHAPDIASAHDFVAGVRAKYPDANHHAWAFRMTAGPQGLSGSADDGEPGGTAGRPMLAILEGSALHEVVAVGTRYFGGIKLGTGGLVRAYGGAVRQALQSLPTAERILHHLARVAVDYGLYGNLQYLLPKHRVRVDEIRFTEVVTMTLAIPYDHTKDVADLLRELTNGRLLLEHCWRGERYDAQV
jgi:uncharacterized YigZ family protein